MKKMKKSFCLSIIIACLMFVSGILTACGTKKVTLSAENNVTTAQPGQSIQLLVDNKKPEGFTFTINEGEEYATLSEDGVLTIKNNATPGNKVKVVAEKGKTTSNELLITVGSINLTNLVASSTTTEVLRNNNYNLYCVKTPTNTTETVTWQIIDGADHAKILENMLLIKENATYGAIIKVKAQGETLSSNILEFTVVEVSNEGLTLRGYDSVDNLDSATSGYTYSVSVVNNLGQNVEGKNLTYFLSQEDQNLLQVSQNGYNFTLNAIGHGTATLRINLGEEVLDVEVECIKAPEQIKLPEVFDTKNNISFKTGINKPISSFNFNLTGTNVCQDFTVKFEKSNDNGKTWIEESTVGEFGTYSNGTLTLKAEGQIKLTATTNSGSAVEKSVSQIFHVNNGINVTTFEEFHTAVKQSTGEPINIVNMSGNKLIPEFITNNEQTSANILSVKMTVSSGKLHLNGNGYEVDLSGLALETTQLSHLGTFLHIYEEYTEGTTYDIHNVKIYDFTLTGNVDINNENINGKYRRGIEISGDKEKIPYLVQMDNVKVSNFSVGLRVAHAVSVDEDQTSKISNLTIQNIWSNGVEVAASQMIFDSLDIGLCGGFGIEVTPDSFDSAGLKFDQNQDIKLMGSWNVSNANNGNSKYFSTVTLKGITVPEIINAMLVEINNKDIISNIKNDADEINMIALKFNNVKGFPTIIPNTSTVTQGAFSSSIIDFTDLSGIDTTHKYIKLDLNYSVYNLGSIIVYNWNYQGS